MRHKEAVRRVLIASGLALLSAAAFSKEAKNLASLTYEGFSDFTRQPAAIVEVTGFGKEADAYHSVLAGYCATSTVPCGSLDVDKNDNYKILTERRDELGLRQEVPAVPRTIFYKDGKAVAATGALTRGELEQKVGELYATP